MCELATIITGVEMAGVAMTAVGSIQQGRAAKKQGEYNAQVSENNAVRARNRGTEKENQYRAKTALLKKQQEAHFGASGVDLNSGSPADILAETDKFGEIDALNIRQNTTDEVDGYLSDADFSRLQGSNAQSAGNIGAFSSLLDGAGQVSSKWYKNKPNDPVSPFSVGVKSNSNMDLV